MITTSPINKRHGLHNLHQTNSKKINEKKLGDMFQSSKVRKMRYVYILLFVFLFQCGTPKPHTL